MSSAGGPPEPPPQPSEGEVGREAEVARDTRVAADLHASDVDRAEHENAVTAWLRADATRVPSWLATAASYAWRVLVLIVVTTLAVVVLAELAIVTVPIVLALILATLAGPPVRWLERIGLPSALAALVVVVGGLLVLVGGLAALAPVFVAEARDLGPTVLEGIDDLLVWLEEGPLGIDAAQLEEWFQQALAAVQEQGGELAAGVATALATVVEVVTAAILAVILLFFLVKDGPQLSEWALARVPAEHRPRTAAAAMRAWESLAGYVRGTAMVAAIDAIGIGIGLAIVGVPLVLPLAVLVFFGGFIPVVGATVSGLLAVLVALADGGLTPALIVLGIVILVQQIESDVLQPMIMRRVVPLHPIVILVVLTAGATTVGIIGALLAVPIAASLSAMGNELRLRQEHPDDTDARPLGGPNGRLTEDEDEDTDDDQDEDVDEDLAQRGS